MTFRTIRRTATSGRPQGRRVVVVIRRDDAQTAKKVWDAGRVVVGRLARSIRFISDANLKPFRDTVATPPEKDCAHAGAGK